MTYQTLADYNATGVEGLMGYTSSIVPIFWPLVMFGFWLVILFGLYLKSERKDFVVAFTTASILTSVASFLLGMLPNVMPTIGVVVPFIASIIGVVLLFNRTDVD